MPRPAPHRLDLASYPVRERVQTRYQDLDAMGHINNVAFAIDDDSELLEKAREAAFTDARGRAQQYAGLAGDSLGDVLTIKESTSGQEQPVSPGTFERDVAAAPVPVEPGQQELTFTVTVTFALD